METTLAVPADDRRYPTEDNTIDRRVNSEQAHRRLVELGAKLELGHLNSIDFVCIESGTPTAHDMIPGLTPTFISLDGSLLTDSDAHVFSMLPNLTSICANNFRHPEVFLRNIQAFPKLESLALSWTPICDDDLTPLRQHGSLLSLHLAHTEIDNPSLPTIGSIASLELLDLSHTRIDDAGLNDLFGLRNLFTVDLRGSAVTATGQQALTTALRPWLPDVEVLL